MPSCSLCHARFVREHAWHPNIAKQVYRFGVAINGVSYASACVAPGIGIARGVSHSDCSLWSAFWC
jgi:hypothetical protein